MAILAAIILVLYCVSLFSSDSGSNNSEEGVLVPKKPHEPTGKDPDNDKKKSNKDTAKKKIMIITIRSKKYTGCVDSSSPSNTDQRLACTKDNFGKPAVWGRYLGEKAGVSKGLTKKEAAFLHDKDIHILLIYNHFEDATGYENGKKQAKQAIELAHQLNVPKQKAIFADIEPKYKVDSNFIQGWNDTLHDAKYKSGIYGSFAKGTNLTKAFLAINDDAKDAIILWSSEPQQKTTTKKDAPSFNPQGPDQAKLYGWQYAIEAKECDIDLNIFKQEMIESLW
ncbi:DUF1906 domain-containing protein [Virgibacillus sp. 179-BFC.A HS]|uniref:DUF1906 domain-containing protein n=1 Tax=Tigheibacillus jepli TaxID=3035914 RepID=A0ABU5CLS0_9BACI|nr:glycoside hydrolase domain-containing protein [Virgibacillus sp. 179-BFC.A HS]MDY0406405.1 DUF1906 domain-containing protein [Virgibacillus sp. 179-BFC.A HS]